MPDARIVSRASNVTVNPVRLLRQIGMSSAVRNSSIRTGSLCRSLYSMDLKYDEVAHTITDVYPGSKVHQASRAEWLSIKYSRTQYSVLSTQFLNPRNLQGGVDLPVIYYPVFLTTVDTCYRLYQGGVCYCKPHGDAFYYRRTSWGLGDWASRGRINQFPNQGTNHFEVTDSLEPYLGLPTSSPM